MSDHGQLHRPPEELALGLFQLFEIAEKFQIPALQAHFDAMTIDVELPLLGDLGFGLALPLGGRAEDALRRQRPQGDQTETAMVNQQTFEETIHFLGSDQGIAQLQQALVAFRQLTLQTRQFSLLGSIRIGLGLGFEQGHLIPGVGKGGTLLLNGVAQGPDASELRMDDKR